MALVIVIPLAVVGAIGAVVYLLYRFVIYDAMCNRSVEKMLREYSIDKSQSQIVREYHKVKGTDLSSREADNMAKHYRQKDPDQFLEMYETVRDHLKNNRD